MWTFEFLYSDEEYRNRRTVRIEAWDMLDALKEFNEKYRSDFTVLLSVRLIPDDRPASW